MGEQILSDSERSPSEMNRHKNKDNIILNTPIIEDDDDNHIDIISPNNEESANYDIGKKSDFQDLPSLPLDESREKSTNNIKQIMSENANKLIISGPTNDDKNKPKSANQINQNPSNQNIDRLAVPSYSSRNNITGSHRGYYKVNNIKLGGIEQIEQKQELHP